MAIKSDDFDIRKSWLTTTLGGNGDYYIQVIEEDKQGIKTVNSTRICMSGGYPPSEVRIAVAELYRAMEKHNLNEYPTTNE